MVEMGILDRFGSKFFFPNRNEFAAAASDSEQGSGPGRAVGMNPVQ